MSFFQILGYPFGIIMRLIHSLTHHYAITIPLMAIVIYVAMLPIQKWQNKNIQKLDKILPDIQEIKKKFKTPEEQAAQLEPLYKSVHYVPFANVFGLIIRTLCIIIMYMALLYPLLYIHGFTNNQLTKFAQTGLFSHYAIMNDASFISQYGNADQLALTLFNHNLAYTPWQQPIWLIIPLINSCMAFFSQYWNKTHIHDNKVMNFLFGPVLNALFPLIIFIRIPAILGLFWLVYSFIGFCPLLYRKIRSLFKKKEIVVL